MLHFEVTSTDDTGGDWLYSYVICSFVPFTKQYIIPNFQGYFQNIIYRVNVKITILIYGTELPKFLRKLLLPSLGSCPATELHVIGSQHSSLDSDLRKHYRYHN
jgi:hypothetical protein